MSQSQTPIEKANQAGSSPPPSGGPPKTWISQPPVVITAPISTTNITGLRTWWRGSSLRSESSAARSDDRPVEERARLVAKGLVGHRPASFVEGEVELQRR